jgi:preprotein translocase subunit SecD
VSNPVPQPAFQPGAPPPRNGRPTAATRLVVMVLLVVLVLGYLLALFLTRDVWSGREGTRAVFATQPGDGSPPPPNAMAQAVNEVKARLAERGVADAEITAHGSNVVATFEGRDLDSDTLRNMFGPEETTTLYIRPLIQSMPAEAGTPPPRARPLPPPGPGSDPAELITYEKELRQSTAQTFQDLAMQFQSTRCDEDDVLAGHDDPQLPLITCSTDGKTVYLLDRSILGGEDVQDATAGLDAQRGQHVVDLKFDDNATRTWADYTSVKVGTQTAFTLDTQVLSAPQIQEAIPGGRTQITGNFTADSARELADALNGGSSPAALSFESSADEMLPATTFSKVLRVAVIAAGLGLALVVGGAVAYLARRA